MLKLDQIKDIEKFSDNIISNIKIILTEIIQIYINFI